MAKKKIEKNEINRESHISKGNVLDDLGFSPEMSAVVKMKSELFDKLITIIEKKKITPRTLEKILDKPQPRISELLNGKISKLSIEKLLEYLERLGGQVSISIKVKKVA
ncbi:MAG: XRE family transcriptional regulator [Bdellovibrionales bacterium]|jgi:predicted XRE-type DNA-binding protein|nr:XRE family transcriptional regulator [Bdellovibrionales bacterium]MBT3524826.1 XRE family transcriptional regulator [Bdellovibrionales bacterium]MBT7668962.1 XRE family transcriptional regulator [Bdellovibrionales bacterium]MBT7767492.1 XRE family transcriptional regulator [Bdellovibrionales bacterium]